MRKRAVARVVAGESPEVVIAAYGFNRLRIYDWLAKYRAGGEHALETRPIPERRRKPGDELAQKLREVVLQDPRQLGNWISTIRCGRAR